MNFLSLPKDLSNAWPQTTLEAGGVGKVAAGAGVRLEVEETTGEGLSVEVWLEVFVGEGVRVNEGVNVGEGVRVCVGVLVAGVSVAARAAVWVATASVGSSVRV